MFFPKLRITGIVISPYSWILILLCSIWCFHCPSATNGWRWSKYPLEIFSRSRSTATGRFSFSKKGSSINIALQQIVSQLAAQNNPSPAPATTTLSSPSSILGPSSTPLPQNLFTPSHSSFFSIPTFTQPNTQQILPMAQQQFLPFSRDKPATTVL